MSRGGRLTDRPLMRAREIDDEGIWSSGSEPPISLLESRVPVPEKCRIGRKLQATLLLLKAIDHFDYCPKCESQNITGIVLMLESVLLFPARCCDMMLWFSKKDYDEIDFSRFYDYPEYVNT